MTPNLVCHCYSTLFGDLPLLVFFLPLSFRSGPSAGTTVVLFPCCSCLEFEALFGPLWILSPTNQEALLFQFLAHPSIQELGMHSPENEPGKCLTKNSRVLSYPRAPEVHLHIGSPQFAHYTLINK